METETETLQDLVRAKIENLRPKLLDLSRRNPLIATKLGPRSNSHIRAVDELPDVLYFKLNNNQEMHLVALPAIEDDPRDELTDEFREGLTNARLTDDIYLADMEGIDKDADDYLDKSREAERALKDRVRELIGLETRVEKTAVNLVQHAKNNGVLPSYELPTAESEHEDGRHTDDNIQTLLLPTDLERKLNSILSKCRTWIQETGMNVLHVAFGFLEWSDGIQTETSFAPLVLLQAEVQKRRTSEGTKFSIVGNGEEAELNTVLEEKLRSDFGIELPKFDGTSIESYLKAVAEITPKKLTWRVRRQVAIGVFPSARMAMYHDLDPSQPSFPASDIIQALLAGGNSEGASPFADEYDVDEPEVESKVPYLIMDADSSQFSALVDVAQGKNVAIEGPPGTGKSQTIVNMIAGALGKGKRVLFVAEKLAALNVVKSRLEAVGLGEFLLPLQAEKSTREQVIESIRERLEMDNSRVVREYDEKLTQFRRVREQLAEYIELVSSSYAQTGLTVHEILGKSILTNPRLQDVSNDVLGRGTIHAQFLSSSGLASLLNIGDQLERAHSDSAGAKPIWKKTGLLNPDRFTIEDICALSRRASVQLVEVANARNTLTSCGLQNAPQEFLKAMLDCLQASLPLVNIFSPQPLIELLRDDRIEELETFTARCKATSDDAAELSELLAVNPSQEALAALKKIIAVCQRFEIATISREELATELTARLSSAQTSYRVAALLQPLIASVPASASWNVSEISTAKYLVDAAGREALLLRNMRTNEPNSSYRLSRLCEEGLELKAIGAELATRSSLPKGMTVEQLTTCASVLRSSGTFSMFSAQYRGAKRLCLSIFRKSKFSKPNAVLLLEELIDFCRREEEFNHHCTTTGLFGPEFRGLATRFDVFNALVRYYEDIESKFGRPTNASLRAFLREGELSVLNLLPSFPATNLAMNYEALRQRGLEMEADSHRIEQAIKELRACEHVLRNDDATRSELEGVEEGLAKLLENRVRLDGDQHVRAILGSAFSGYKTRVDKLDALAAWARGARKHARSVLEILQHADANDVIAAIQPVLKAEDDAQSTLAQLTDLSKTDIHAFFDGVAPREAANKFEEAAADSDGLFAHAKFFSALHEVLPHGILPLVEERLGVDHSLDGLAGQCEALAVRQIARSVYSAHGPKLTKYSGSKLDELRAALARQDREIIQLSRRQLRSHVQSSAQPPRGNGVGRKSTWTNMALIENELSKKQRFVPVRDLTQRAGQALLELKPCWMMSPLAVAQYIPKGALQFDLCIIDEASQMPPESAIGALLRCNQVVVVGDTNQLPPSSFFKALIDDDEVDEDEAVLSESVLEMANATFRPARRLRWHYRSRHSGLIKFSNRLVYDDNLVVFPSATEAMTRMGVEYRKIEGRYKAGTNPIEAKAVIDAALEFMRTDPDRSLGIVTLNQKQRDLINEEFEYTVANDKRVQRYIEAWREKNDGLEEFFIKNLENVQGDERDVIFIGTVYGPEQAGARVMQRFGPINGLAGKRRLNVLLTRAKEKIVTFSSMTAGDIQADELGNPGTYMLKRWLEYSASGVLDAGDVTPREPDSDFEMFVIEQIKSMGCVPVPQVGVAGYFIDIGIRHTDWPHGFILGVECDGASYHSAKSARDRDRLRQEVLEQLGWKLHRIWSTDWFNNPQRESEKLRKAITERIAFLKTREAEFVKQPKPKMASSIDNSTTVTTESPQPSHVEDVRQRRDAKTAEAAANGVAVGDTVRVRYLTDDKRTMQLTISKGQPDASSGIINEHSPIAQALLGVEQGEEVEVLIGRYIRRAVVEHIFKNGAKTVATG
jgi:hypothetical protein